MPKLSKIAVTLLTLESEGFDLCSAVSLRGSHVHVGCSQCQALVINRTAVHERNCPRETHECRGCNDRIPVRVKYCPDCQ